MEARGALKQYICHWKTTAPRYFSVLPRSSGSATGKRQHQVLRALSQCCPRAADRPLENDSSTIFCGAPEQWIGHWKMTAPVASHTFSVLPRSSGSATGKRRAPNQTQQQVCIEHGRNMAAALFASCTPSYRIRYFTYYLSIFSWLPGGTQL